MRLSADESDERLVQVPSKKTPEDKRARFFPAEFLTLSVHHTLFDRGFQWCWCRLLIVSECVDDVTGSGLRRSQERTFAKMWSFGMIMLVVFPLASPTYSGIPSLEEGGVQSNELDRPSFSTEQSRIDSRDLSRRKHDGKIMRNKYDGDRNGQRGILALLARGPMLPDARGRSNEDGDGDFDESAPVLLKV
ncbi:hypothetical protein GWI33_005460 [Rhynchophorus ferrugineus]|uniref:Uncharacterized protein n=1 Tax=Rhynchophorus ferrugineus TaxID=354439 RepID=A0A834MHZ8_RHYFE|nr:hypothetical protein GWI33_005460 [Rhynchophorus ferrugineus]